MTESAVLIAAAQGPMRRAFDRFPGGGIVTTQLAERKDRVESRMAVPRGHVQEPASILFLVAQGARHDLFRHWGGFSDQTIIMGCVECRRDMVVQITIGSLD